MEYFKYCPWDGYRFAATDVQCFICKRPKYTINSNEEINQTQKKWEKILYEKQPYDDNYIDETFLSSVVKQDNSDGPDYKQLINKTSDLIFTINSAVMYLIIYYLMLHDIIDTTWIFAFWTIVTIGTVTIYITLLNYTLDAHQIVSNIKTFGIYISILLLFAPVMQTINQTYSDDTIYVLTLGSILVYLFMKNYDYESEATLETWQVDVSHWASMLFSSLLASRLNNEFQVFLMIYSSLLVFIFAQFAKTPFKDHKPTAFTILNVMLSVTIGITLLLISYFLALLYCGIVFFITFVSPLQLVWLYQYKNTIQGPWDLPDVKQYD